MSKLPPESQRTVSPSVAAAVSWLEERRRQTVTAAELAKLAGLAPGSPAAVRLTTYLREHGWIRPLSMRGAYEFLPALGGPLPSGDPWIELRVALTRRPDTSAHVGLGSAAWLRGLSDRRSARDLVIWDEAVSASPGLRRTYNLVRTARHRIFGAEPLDGVPVATASRLVLEAALWWHKAGDLRSPTHWVGPALAESDAQSVREGAQILGPTVVARAGFLADQFGAPAIAAALRDLPHTGPTFLGPRGAHHRSFNSEWRVYDTVGVQGLG